MKLTAQQWLIMALAIAGIANVAIAWQASGKGAHANSLPVVTPATAVAPKPTPGEQQAQATSPYYLDDDIQYFPVGPEFKLSRDAAALKAYVGELKTQAAGRQDR